MPGFIFHARTNVSYRRYPDSDVVLQIDRLDMISASGPSVDDDSFNRSSCDLGPGGLGGDSLELFFRSGSILCRPEDLFSHQRLRG
jgi:hypothetical protein